MIRPRRDPLGMDWGDTKPPANDDTTIGWTKTQIANDNMAGTRVIKHTKTP